MNSMQPATRGMGTSGPRRRLRRHSDGTSQRVTVPTPQWAVVAQIADALHWTHSRTVAALFALLFRGDGGDAAYYIERLRAQEEDDG